MTLNPLGSGCWEIHVDTLRFFFALDTLIMPAMNIARQLPIRTTQRQFSLYNRASHCRGHSSSSRMEDKQNALRIGAAAVLLSTTAGLLTLQASPKGLPPERTTFGEVMPLDRYTSCAANTIEPMQRRPNAFEVGCSCCVPTISHPPL